MSILKEHTLQATVKVILHVHSLSDLKDVFQPLLEHIEKRYTEQHHDENSTGHLRYSHLNLGNELYVPELKEQVIQTGAKIKVKWTASEIGETGWRPAWLVQCYRTIV